jgi:trehalose-6-phosphate synthase
MYLIKFIDPMTDLAVEARSTSLDEAVVLIKKAKDELYYKGNQLSLSGEEDEPTDELASESSDLTEDKNNTFNKVFDEDDDYQEYYDNFFWYP